MDTLMAVVTFQCLNQKSHSNSVNCLVCPLFKWLLIIFVTAQQTYRIRIIRKLIKLELLQVALMGVIILSSAGKVRHLSCLLLEIILKYEHAERLVTLINACHIQGWSKNLVAGHMDFITHKYTVLFIYPHVSTCLAILIRWARGQSFCQTLSGTWKMHTVWHLIGAFNLSFSIFIARRNFAYGWTR